MTDDRLDYVASSTAMMAEHARMSKDVSEKRGRALRSLAEDGWTVTQIAEATGINRQTLYKALRVGTENTRKGARANRESQ